MSDAARALTLPGFLPPETVLGGKYRIDELIAEGGMGVVYQAFHLVLEQRIAVKVVRSEYAHQPETVARFLNEARAIARLRGNHIAHVLDTGSLPGGQPYMVLDYLDGSDLRTILAAEGPLGLERALTYVLQTCEALAEAHAIGLVHRDLKPENLFITRSPDGEEVVKVIDFGISKRLDGSERSYTLRGQSLGSPHYMAPEQMTSPDAVDGRADVWSLGVVLYEMLSNQLPFPGQTLTEVCASVLHSEPRPLRVLRPELPLAVEQIVRRCLQKSLGARYANVGELVSALLPLAAAGGVASGLRAQRISERAAGPKRLSESRVRPAAVRRTRWPLALVATLAIPLTLALLAEEDGPRAQTLRAAPLAPLVRVAPTLAKEPESLAAPPQVQWRRATALHVAPAASLPRRTQTAPPVNERRASSVVQSPAPTPVKTVADQGRAADISGFELLWPYPESPQRNPGRESRVPSAKGPLP